MARLKTIVEVRERVPNNPDCVVDKPKETYNFLGYLSREAAIKQAARAYIEDYGDVEADEDNFASVFDVSILTEGL